MIQSRQNCFLSLPQFTYTEENALVPSTRSVSGSVLLYGFRSICPSVVEPGSYQAIQGGDLDDASL